MLMIEQRKQLVDYGKLLIDRGLTTGTGGNLSIFDPTQKLMAITPSGIAFHDTTPEDIVIMNLDGQVVEGIRKPSSEVDLHRIFYQNRSDILAVVHSHSTYCTTISCMGWTLPAVHYALGVAGGDVRCAPYRTYGSYELAQGALESMEGRYAVLLANHGMLAGGSNIAEALDNVATVEFVAELYYRTKSLSGPDQPQIIGDEQMIEVMRKFGTYGQ